MKRIAVFWVSIVGRPPRVVKRTAQRLITRDEIGEVRKRVTPNAWFDLGPYFVEFDVPAEIQQKLREAETQFQNEQQQANIIQGTLVTPP